MLIPRKCGGPLRRDIALMYVRHREARPRWMPSIFSPDVVFFRDGRFHLLKEPVEASVLTLPAVNMGQVILNGCGVFRNDPVKVAGWWKELLGQYFPGEFDTIVYAVLDRSGTRQLP